MKKKSFKSLFNIQQGLAQKRLLAHLQFIVTYYNNIILGNFSNYWLLIFISFCLQLISPSSERIFQAVTDQEVQEWVTAIQVT